MVKEEKRENEWWSGWGNATRCLQGASTNHIIEWGAGASISAVTAYSSTTQPSAVRITYFTQRVSCSSDGGGDECGEFTQAHTLGAMQYQCGEPYLCPTGAYLCSNLFFIIEPTTGFEDIWPGG